MERAISYQSELRLELAASIQRDERGIDPKIDFGFRIVPARPKRRPCLCNEAATPSTTTTLLRSFRYFRRYVKMNRVAPQEMQRRNYPIFFIYSNYSAILCSILKYEIQSEKIRLSVKRLEKNESRSFYVDSRSTVSEDV